MLRRDIDPTDLQIINILQRNAYVTNVEVATEIGLAPTNALKRTRMLLKKGVFRILGILNFSYFGYSFRTLITVRLPSAHVEAFISLVRGDPYVLRAYLLRVPEDKVSGKRSVLYETIGKTQNEFIGRIAAQYQQLPYYDMMDFDLFPVHKVVKDETFLEITEADTDYSNKK